MPLRCDYCGKEEYHSRTACLVGLKAELAEAKARFNRPGKVLADADYVEGLLKERDAALAERDGAIETLGDHSRALASANAALKTVRGEREEWIKWTAEARASASALRAAMVKFAEHLKEPEGMDHPCYVL